jgi:hypothetical protein
VVWRESQGLRFDKLPARVCVAKANGSTYALIVLMNFLKVIVSAVS